MSETKALTITMPSSPLRKVDEVRDFLSQMAEKAHVLTPLASIDYVPPMMAISTRAVMIDTSFRDVKIGDRKVTMGTDCYVDSKFCGPDEVALTKTGILRILQAAAIDVEDSYRIDDGLDPLLATWRIILSAPTMDGRRQKMVGTKTIDLRDGSPNAKQMTDKQLAMARQKIQEMAETKALLRAARSCLALRQKYTKQELAKPFIALVPVPDLDANDPEIKRMIAAKHLDIAGAIYGGRPIRPSLPPGVGPGGELLEAPIISESGEDDGYEDADAEVEDIAPLPEPQGEAPALKCACPCGCKATLTEAVASATTREGGSARCRECWPSRAFDYERHKHLSDLGLKPRLTPDQAKAYSDKIRAGVSR